MYGHKEIKPDPSTDEEGHNDYRMIVVGGWHQDYRHGQGACVRFNLRQVGTYIKYCADGDEEQFNAKISTPEAENSLYKNPTGDTQLWSRDNQRCTWNWNYNVLGSTYDAESWFDSIDPLHFQVWDTASSSISDPTQEDVEMFIDEPAPGSTNTAGYQAAVRTGSLTSPVTISLVLQERKRDVNGVTWTTGGYKQPILVMDSSYTTTSTYAELVHASLSDEYTVFDDSDGTIGQVILTCNNDGKYNGGYDPLKPELAARMRDHFPDCYFGDEIHGQWQWDDGLEGIESASNTAIWKFWAMLYSHE